MGLEQPYLLIVASSLAIGLAAGIVMHRAGFCMTACFRDAFLFRDFFLLRQLLLLIVVSMALFEIGRLTGLIGQQPFPLLGPPSLTNVLGGFVFGIGMVPAGGCVCGSLYKLGAGSAIGLLAVAGMLAGSVAYAEIFPVWSALAKATQLGASITLPQSLGLTPAWLVLPLAALGGLWLGRAWRSGLLHRSSMARGHLEPWRAALLLALLGFLSYVLVGMPMGITTSYAKLGASLLQPFAPDYLASREFFSLQPLNYIPPGAATAIQGGPGPALDAIAAIQYPLLAGIVLGAAGSAARLGEWRWPARPPWRQAAAALLGGLLLGLAARMAPACNVWHLWGGLPILAWQSLLFAAGLLPGAWLGSRLLHRFVII